MIHPNTELKMVSPEMGIGVFATHFIPKGTITWAQDELDIVLSPQAIKYLSNINQRLKNMLLEIEKANLFFVGTIAVL